MMTFSARECKNCLWKLAVKCRNFAEIHISCRRLSESNSRVFSFWKISKLHQLENWNHSLIRSFQTPRWRIFDKLHVYNPRATFCRCCVEREDVLLPSNYLWNLFFRIKMSLEFDSGISILSYLDATGIMHGASGLFHPNLKHPLICYNK